MLVKIANTKKCDTLTYVYIIYILIHIPVHIHMRDLPTGTYTIRDLFAI